MKRRVTYRAVRDASVQLTALDAHRSRREKHLIVQFLNNTLLIYKL